MYARVLEERGRSLRGDQSVKEGNQLADGIIQDEDVDEHSSELKNENRAAVDKDCTHCSQLGWIRWWFHVGGRNM